MAASTQRGPIRAQPAGHLPRAATERPLPSPANGRRGGWWEAVFTGTADQVRLVRAVVGRLLAGCPVADDVVLLMSELGANAVRHSGSGRDGGTFTVRLLDVPGQYVLGEIVDGGSDWDGDLQGSARNASGLCLVLALSAACGVSGGRHGRAVWFRVHYPVAGSVLAAQVIAPGGLPLRVPGAQGPLFPAPRWNPNAPGRAVRPEVLERVHAALTRL
jgi:serine/threonine-protein kinase RsbW